MKVFLLGYMGCGKSTIGRKLANILQYKFIDLDEFIENEELHSITGIFEEKGEDYFRNIESQYLRKVIEHDNAVISLGGGTPCFNNNIETINTSGKSVYISLTPKMLCNRLINAKQNRPLIANKSVNELLEYIEVNLSERLPFYQKALIEFDGANVSTERLEMLKNKLLDQ